MSAPERIAGRRVLEHGAFPEPRSPLGLAAPHGMKLREVYNVAICGDSPGPEYCVFFCTQDWIPVGFERCASVPVSVKVVAASAIVLRQRPSLPSSSLG